MAESLTVPSTFEEATALWASLGQKLSGAHLDRARLVYAILNEPDPDKFGGDWTADGLGKAWGVTGERIRRYARTVKVLGNELDGLVDLPSISWTHLEELARISDPGTRSKVLEAIQAEKLPSNEARALVAGVLAAGGAAAELGGLSHFPGSAAKKAAQVPAEASFPTDMETLAKWAASATTYIQHLASSFGAGKLLGLGVFDQMGASDARNRLDDLTSAIQELRPLLCGSPPQPKPDELPSVALNAMAHVDAKRSVDF